MEQEIAFNNPVTWSQRAALSFMLSQPSRDARAKQFNVPVHILNKLEFPPMYAFIVRQRTGMRFHTRVAQVVDEIAKQ